MRDFNDNEHFWGRDTTDPNGNAVRIGGWTSWCNFPGNAETINGTIHFADERTYRTYLDHPLWQDHEEGHIDQELTPVHMPIYILFWFYAVAYEIATGDRTKGNNPIGHDHIPFEAAADDYAIDKEFGHLL